MRIEELRKLAGREEIDYQFLLSALQHYSRPRDKITTWLKSGDLIRVKKGLYIFGQSAARKPYSTDLLANLVYGPSAISLTYAVSFYGLIPERANLITSITVNRNKLFATPVGKLQYYYLNPKKYAIGINLNYHYANQHFLIATPEKALCDQIYIIDKQHKFSNAAELENYLCTA